MGATTQKTKAIYRPLAPLKISEVKLNSTSDFCKFQIRMIRYYALGTILINTVADATKTIISSLNQNLNTLFEVISMRWIINLKI